MEPARRRLIGWIGWIGCRGSQDLRLAVLTASKLTVFDAALIEESNEYGLPLGTGLRSLFRNRLAGDCAGKRWSRQLSRERRKNASG
ncbi:hypothetical protein K0M31_005995 [Melipona bicolor]|uniref:Uncharacterized protein n=1 Tax=Melipona bicolor TaxID=60889 RepID=A0AA40FTB5_9HYME|nr:hypothetical protein K0M31_005995 [Melipona bicolor]